MQTPADRVIAEILHAEDLFLIEIGRLTLLFSRIEDCLVTDARLLAPLSDDEGLKTEAAAPALLHGRLLEKRDFLKRVYADIARHYGVENRRLDKVLDGLGNINRLRRTIVHGWLRWSEGEDRPVFVDSRGESLPAWPHDVRGVNLKVLTWDRDYFEEKCAIMIAVKKAHNDFIERLASHPKLPPGMREMIAHIKTRADETERP